MKKFDYIRHSSLRQSFSKASNYPAKDKTPRETGLRPSSRDGFNLPDQPLPTSDAFRILKLHPGPQDAPIECNLLVRHLRSETSSNEKRNLKEPERYEALSYYWGPQDGDCFVKILADSEASRIAIGPNLDSALRQLRLEDRPRYLWVDALCINQEDKEERSTQIPLMRLIYNHADSVVVWLGDRADDSDKAMDFIERCLDMEQFDRLVKEVFASQEWAALSSLMRRPWFNRRWIVQEISLARRAEVYCGSKMIEWRKFASVILMLSRRQPELRQLFRESSLYGHHPDYLGDLSELGAIRLADVSANLCRKLSDGTITERLFPLEGLISSLTSFQGSDPHDVLYAILWLANDAQPVTKNAWHVNLPEMYASFTQTPVSMTFSPVQMSRVSSGGNAGPTEKFPDFNDAQLRPTSPSMRRQRSRSDLTVPTTRPHSRRRSEDVPSISVSEAGEDANRPGSSASHNPQSPLSSKSQPMAESDPNILSSDDHVPLSRAPSHSISSNSAEIRRPGKPRLSISTAIGEDERKRAAGFSFLQRLKDRRIVVDYNKSVFEVCKDVVDFVLRHSSSLDILCKPWAPSSDKPENEPLPSWIPQLSGGAFAPTANGIARRVNADALVGKPGHPTDGPKPYRASGGRPAQWKFGPALRSLVVDGFVLDQIKKRLEPATNGYIPAEWMEAAGWNNASELPPDLFWNTLVGNRDSAGKPPPLYWQACCRDAFRQRPHGGALGIQDVMFNCPTLVGEFLERVQRVVWNRRLVLLDKATKQNGTALALAPCKAKKGDLICILDGCSVPVVLRKIIDGEPASKRRKCHHLECPSNNGVEQGVDGLESKSEVHYELIGECYVQGMMDGEAFPVETQSFDLR